MNAIPEDKLIKITPSPLYFGEINSPGQPTLNDLKRIEQNAIGSCKLPSKDKILLRSDKFPKMYEPLILPTSNDNTLKTLGDCAWKCIKEEFVGQEMIEIATLGSASIPKFVGGMPHYKGTSFFTSYLSLVEHRDKKLKVTMGRMPAPTMRYMIPQLKHTTYVLRFFGRWIPMFGWALLAKDVLLISLCTNKCMKQINNTPTIDKLLKAEKVSKTKKDFLQS